LQLVSSLLACSCGAFLVGQCERPWQCSIHGATSMYGWCSLPGGLLPCPCLAAAPCLLGTPLHEAVLKGNGDVARVLMLSGADATTKDKKGRSALDYARTHRGELAARLEETLTMADDTTAVGQTTADEGGLAPSERPCPGGTSQVPRDPNIIPGSPDPVLPSSEPAREDVLVATPIPTSRVLLGREVTEEQEG
ncbi:hypothetical protein CYMTET_28175, partial [Cymbomonas tetramitiformis]